jgi:hypothetical protein
MAKKITYVILMKKNEHFEGVRLFAIFDNGSKSIAHADEEFL